MSKTNLFIHGVSVPKNDIASNQPSNEGINVPFFSVVKFLLNQKKTFVNRHEFRQVESVLPRSAIDYFGSGFPAK